MRTNWQNKLALLWEEMQLAIINGVREYGEETSKNFSGKVIHLSDELQYNFGDGDYAVEVYEEGFYSANGHMYPFSSLNYEQISEIADYVESKIKYYQPKWGDEDLITPDGIELWSYYVYSTKELAQKDFPNREILEYSGDDIENPYVIR